ncbi:MAG: thioredoxin domain-containing protein [Sphingobacteriales bacterium JAD_PAG50586_3]|nr:MAG: thioredoxin domain-containing protein [Sphingobacteriales bacterium JAD_PAG50586_3]
MVSDKKYTNQLINETSPYLLQHAHNPVNWYPWGEEALAKAKAENKMLLVSVGYSACHWCHVMERECFENEEVAALMNEYFINIKVDREERPDIDQVYMSAVQLMTGRGGWPLNCITLPDGRPIYGGTYFPKDNWMAILQQMAEIFTYERERAEDYAAKLTEGVALSGLAIKSTATDINWDGVLNETVATWMNNLDNVEGGPARAPKFPLPNNYLFLLRYATLYKNENLLKHVNLTLTKMAYGGIYDQLGGGFARYSVDGFWKVPHFEKMLYDNAQLVSLYAEAYKATGIVLYKEVVDDTLGFIERELTSPEGLFYSALDADSEGEEGKFYVWKKEELTALLGNDFAVFADYFNINLEGLWEHGNYILLRKKDEQTLAAQHGLSVSDLKDKVASWKNLLLAERAKKYVRDWMTNAWHRGTP